MPTAPTTPSSSITAVRVQAAKKFYAANVNNAVAWPLADGSLGLKITKGTRYGIYTLDGKIVSFGFR